MRSARRRWRRWRSLSASERRLVAASLLLLPGVAAGIRLRGLAAVQRRLLAAAERTARRMDDERLACAPDPYRAAFLVLAAGRRGLWRPNCLQHSLVLWWWLRSHRSEAELRIGVRRLPDAPRPQFHAWVELDGEVLNDAESDVATYVAFDRPIAPDGATFT